MATEGQGSLVINEISTDSGATWKLIMCEKDSTITGTNTVNEVKTKCATYTYTSKDAMKVSGSGVANGDLTSGQISYQQMQILRDAETRFLFRRYNTLDGTLAVGELSYAKFNAYLTSVAETAAEEGLVEFTWEVTSTGTIDLDPAS